MRTALRHAPRACAPAGVRYYRCQNDSGDGAAARAITEPFHTWAVFYRTSRQ